MYRYLFGPVPSRRLGISLGIDLVPMKTCTLDCIYCECGKQPTFASPAKNTSPLNLSKPSLTITGRTIPNRITLLSPDQESPH